jgi:class 3 adenylate cyclase
MRCPSCTSENPETTKFCGSCGAPLEAVCPNCGAENPPQFKFCGECGTPLRKPRRSPEPARPRGSPLAQNILRDESGAGAEPADGERKTVTALFADIKGSTELMRDLDPEEARAIVDPALKLMIDAAHIYDGYVVQSTGDGIFALFGAPVAHEDHPQRALHAAIAMRDALRRSGEELKKQGRSGVEVRIGINTGEVVLRMIHTGGHTEYTPVGHVANLAARMQSVAPAAGIVISEETRRLVEGYFELRALGKTEVKGVSEPLSIYQVVGVGALRGHFELAARRGLTKFVGREREVAELKRALELTRSGHGQIVAAVAEAGTGKSRWVYEFKAMLPSDCKVLEAHSVSHGKASAYLPVLELLYGYFGIEEADDKAARRTKIEARLSALDPALNDTLPLLYTLMGLHEGPDPLAQMDPQIKRRRTLDAIKRIILRESLIQPTVVIFEDLHWIDSETQALLDLVADGIANASLLLLVNYRPEYSHAWTNKSYYTQLRLDALGRESAGQMLSMLLGDGVELEPLKRMVIERTEGNPFFIEEMVQALFDEGALVRNGTVKVARSLPQLRLPPTVQGILASRIDRLLREHKELIQTLAVMGRESPLALIKLVASQPDGELERMLGNLQAGEFIYEQSGAAGSEYTFKHALTQEVAYNSLLIERRKLLHERVGAATESLYVDRLDDHLSQLAHHYSSSANTRKAAHFLGRAGRQAAERSAYSEALGFLTKALELLGELPDDTKRAFEEFELQMALSWLVYQTKGPGAPERQAPVVRARELAEQLGDETKLTEVLIALSNLMCNRGTPGMREVAEHALALAERGDEPALLAGAHYELGHVLYFFGEFSASNEHVNGHLNSSAPARPELSGKRRTPGGARPSRFGTRSFLVIRTWPATKAKRC